jgi:hypothetical protein
MIYNFKSSYLSLFFHYKIQHILTPWIVYLNLERMTLTIKKRNWFLIGFNIETIPVNRIRNIFIDEHVVGADIHITIYGSSLSAYYLRKTDAKTIKNNLI